MRPAVFVNRENVLVHPDLRPIGLSEFAAAARKRYGYKPGTACHWIDYPEKEMRSEERAFMRGLRYWLIWEMAHVRFFRMAIEGLRRLAEAEYLVVVVANQGELLEAGMEIELLPELHRSIVAGCRMCGARVDASYLCFHLPSESCDCRLPNPRLLVQAAEDMQIDLTRSWMIDSRGTFLEGGLQAGLPPERLIRVNEGGDEQHGEFGEPLCDAWYAVNRILGDDV